MNQEEMIKHAQEREQKLFEATARYFNESSELDEKRIVAQDGTVYDVPDQYLQPTELGTASGDEENDPDAIPVATAQTINTNAVGKDLKTAARTANTAAWRERVANATSAAFDSVKPQIESVIEKAAAYCLKNGIVAYDTDTESWSVDSKNLRAFANKLIWGGDDKQGIYSKIIVPQMMAAGKGSKASAAIKQSFMNFADTEKTGTDKYKSIISKLVKYAKEQAEPVKTESANLQSYVNAINEDAVKLLFKAFNDGLAKLYSERYKVSLDEANKMFVVNDRLDG